MDGQKKVKKGEKDEHLELLNIPRTTSFQKKLENKLLKKTFKIAEERIPKLYLKFFYFLVYNFKI